MLNLKRYSEKGKEIEGKLRIKVIITVVTDNIFNAAGIYFISIHLKLKIQKTIETNLQDLHSVALNPPNFPIFATNYKQCKN